VTQLLDHESSQELPASRRRNLRDGRAYDRFKELAELPLLIAAIALIPVLAAPYIVEVSDGVNDVLNAVAWFIWAMFVVEYLVLFTLAPSRWHMFRTHIFDLLIIVLPFLRPLRAARSARLLRLLTITGRIGIGFKVVAGRKGVRVFGLVVVLVVFVGGLLTYAFESSHPASNIGSIPDAIWWAIVTATTVGYGDHSPVSAEGRAIAVVLMLVGIGLLGVITANIAAFFVETDEEEKNQEFSDRLDRIERLLLELHAQADTDHRVGAPQEH
jgi:voltage-gated potassium channel